MLSFISPFKTQASNQANRLALGLFGSVALALSFSVLPAHAANELTLYSDGQAFVKEDHTLALQKGNQTYTLNGLPTQLDTSSVRLSRLKESGPDIEWLGTEFLPAQTLNAQSLLSNQVGQSITFMEPSERAWVPGKEAPPMPKITTGKLIALPEAVAGFSTFASPRVTPHQWMAGDALAHDTLAVVEVDGEQRLVPTRLLILKTLPEDFRLKPSLKLALNSPEKASRPFELSYLTSGLSWQPYYTAVLTQNGQLNLQGWATLTNQSGKDFINQPLTLVAGTLNRRAQPQPLFAPKMVMMAARAEGVMADGAVGQPSLEAKALGDYYTYKLPQPITLKNNTSQAVSWFNGIAAPAQTRYVYDPNPGYQWLGYQDNADKTISLNGQPISRLLEWTNTETGTSRGFGKPLVSGAIRVLEADSDGSLQVVGEDQLSEVAKGDKVLLSLGQSMDLKAKKTQTGFHQVINKRLSNGNSSGYNEARYLVTLTNRKPTAQTVEVMEHPQGIGNNNWEVLKPSLPFEKQENHTVVFKVNVPAAKGDKPGQATLTYTVRSYFGN